MYYVHNFQLLRVVHSLWSPSISQALPGEIKAAMAMSDVERFSLLGEENPKLSKNPKEGYGEATESDIRNWIKGIRDSG